jgi:Ni,Fe-hydrogenase maturation factor
VGLPFIKIRSLILRYIPRMVQQNKIISENGATTPTELLSTFLDKEKVQIRDIQAVEAKIGKMKQLSLDKLMVNKYLKKYNNL